MARRSSRRPSARCCLCVRLRVDVTATFTRPADVLRSGSALETTRGEPKRSDRNLGGTSSWSYLPIRTMYSYIVLASIITIQKTAQSLTECSLSFLDRFERPSSAQEMIASVSPMRCKELEIAHRLTVLFPTSVDRKCRRRGAERAPPHRPRSARYAMLRSLARG